MQIAKSVEMAYYERISFLTGCLIMKLFKDLTIGFAAGALGGLAHAIVFWVVNRYGIAQDIGVHFSVPSAFIDTGDLIQLQVLWGALFGFLLAVPLWRASWFKRGLVLALIPTLVMLVYVFPYVTDGGMFGLGHGNFTFVVVLVLNLIYGFIAASWFAYVAGRA